MLKHRKIGDANASRLSHLLAELAKKISNSLGDSGERATEVPGLVLYRRTAPTVPNPSTYEPSLLVIAQGTLHECAFGEEALLAPEATSTSAASGLLFHTVTVCPAFKRLAAIREPIAPRPRNPILLISTPSSTCRTSRSASLREFHHSTATLPKCAPLAW
jgi:hypothetical protein